MKRIVFRRFFSMFVTAAVALGAATGCHHNRSHNPEKISSTIVERASKKLSLDTNQQKLLKEVTDEMVAAATEMRSQRKEHLEFAIAQVKSDTLDKEQILARMEEVHQKMDARVRVALDKLAELHKNLTPEQRTVIIEGLTKVHKRLTEE